MSWSPPEVLPYLPFVEAMRSYVLSKDSATLKRELADGAADVARLVSEVRGKVLVELATGGDPEENRWRLLSAVTTFLHNIASDQPLVIVLEDLNVAGMMKNRRLAQAITDVRLYEFRCQLQCKGAWYGCQIKLADRFVLCPPSAVPGVGS